MSYTIKCMHVYTSVCMYVSLDISLRLVPALKPTAVEHHTRYITYILHLTTHDIHHTHPSITDDV